LLLPCRSSAVDSCKNLRILRLDSDPATGNYDNRSDITAWVANPVADKGQGWFVADPQNVVINAYSRTVVAGGAGDQFASLSCGRAGGCSISKTFYLKDVCGYTLGSFTLNGASAQGAAASCGSFTTNCTVHSDPDSCVTTYDCPPASSGVNIAQYYYLTFSGGCEPVCSRVLSFTLGAGSSNCEDDFYLGGAFIANQSMSY